MAESLDECVACKIFQHLVDVQIKQLYGGFFKHTLIKLVKQISFQVLKTSKPQHHLRQTHFSTHTIKDNDKSKSYLNKLHKFIAYIKSCMSAMIKITLLIVF